MSVGIASNKGFSLLELMMVITIVAVMLGVLVPNMGAMMEATALQRCSRITADILRYARSTAIQSSSTTKVIFDQTSIFTMTPTNTGQNNTVALPDPIQFEIEANPLELPGVFIPRKPPIEIPKEFGNRVFVENIILQSMGGAQQQDIMQHTGTQAQSQFNLMMGLDSNAGREIVFYPDGSTSDTFIHLTNGRKIHTIGIVGLTGQIMRWEEMVESFYVQ